MSDDELDELEEEFRKLAARASKAAAAVEGTTRPARDPSASAAR